VHAGVPAADEPVPADALAPADAEAAAGEAAGEPGELDAAGLGELAAAECDAPGAAAELELEAEQPAARNAAAATAELVSDTRSADCAVSFFMKILSQSSGRRLQ
jgi:hypothetical protein